MVRWGAAIPGFLFLLAACSAVSAAYVGDRFFPSTLATTVPSPADFYNPVYFVKRPDVAATTPINPTAPATSTAREIDIPTTYSRLVTKSLAEFFTEAFRILATAHIRTGRAGLT